MNRLPTGIKKVELTSRKDGRPIIRYDCLIMTGYVDGRRTHVRKRFKTEAEARKFIAETQAEVNRGTYVQKLKLTVDQAIEEWLKSRHNIKQSTRRGYGVWLKPVQEELGHVELQKVTKSQLNMLITRLRNGEVPGHGKWTPTSINSMLKQIAAVMEDRLKQGHIVRNVAKLVDRLPSEKAEMKTLSEEDMWKVIDYPDRDRHLWGLAILMGLRRGEIAGLRRKFVDLEARTLEVAETRLAVGREIITESPKSTRSQRTIPIPGQLVPILSDAFGRIESEWVACGPTGDPYHPNYLTERWGQMLRALDIEYVRLHDARHTCASYMAKRGAPLIGISRFLGHSTPSFTMNVYVHPDAQSMNDAISVFEDKE